MKLKIFLLMLFPCTVFGQIKTFTIKGEIPQYTPGARAYLFYQNGNVAITDSAGLVNGNFTFTGKIDEAVMARLMLRNPTSNGVPVPGFSTELYIEPGIIQITSPDSVNHLKISGTPLNNVYQELRTAMEPHNDQMSKIQKQFALLKTVEEKQNFEKNYPGLNELNMTRLMLLKNFISNHPGSIVSMDVLNTYWIGSTRNLASADSLYQGLSPQVKTSIKGKLYADRMEKLKKLSIGSYAPNFTQADTAGKQISLYSFRGKYVLIDFWASWCVPCRAENPTVVKAYQQYKSKNFTVLGVSLDRPNGRKDWLNAIKKDGLTWTNVTDLKFFKNEAAQLYIVSSIPQNFLIDPQGKIIAKNLRGEELGKKLEEVFR